MRNYGQTSGTQGEDANITSVWNPYTGNGIIISVVDDGLDKDHPDISPIIHPITLMIGVITMQIPLRLVTTDMVQQPEELLQPLEIIQFMSLELLMMLLWLDQL